jgi:hypothetical protein
VSGAMLGDTSGPESLTAAEIAVEREKWLRGHAPAPPQAPIAAASSARSAGEKRPRDGPAPERDDDAADVAKTGKKAKREEEGDEGDGGEGEAEEGEEEAKKSKKEKRDRRSKEKKEKRRRRDA